MKSHLLFVLAGLCLLPLSACGFTLPTVELVVQVADENGKPIGGAEVGAFFTHAYAVGAAAEGEKIVAITDSTGTAVLRGEAASSVAGIAQKEGYYRTLFAPVDFPGMRARGEKLSAHLDLVMKKIVKPVPMFARLLNDIAPPSLVVSSLNTPYGFDLEAGDWVAPHGRGKMTDIIFAINGRYDSYQEFDASLVMTFPNKGDGFVEFEGSQDIGSELRSAHLAPEEGYAPRLSLAKKALLGQDTSKWIEESKPGSNYYLRVRTVMDKDGKVLSANYGKIYGNLDFMRYPDREVFIKAEACYFNPRGE